MLKLIHAARLIKLINSSYIIRSIIYLGSFFISILSQYHSYTYDNSGNFSTYDFLRTSSIFSSYLITEERKEVRTFLSVLHF